MKGNIDQRKETIGRWVRFLDVQFRIFAEKNSGWRTSQADWARFLGVDNATMSAWMKGSRLPSVYYIHYLADPNRIGPGIYNVFPDVAKPMPDDPEAQRLIDLFEKLPDDDARLQVLELAERLTKEITRPVVP